MLAATYMYTQQEAKHHPPIIKFHGDEKSTLTSPTEMGDASIKIPKTPLTAEEIGISTSRPGSPTHKKRKSDQLGYFTKAHE